MNIRQFINSAISKGIEKSESLRKFLYIFPNFIFPEFLRGPLKFQEIKKPFIFSINIYLIVFILVFVVQALFAYQNDVFFATDNGVKDFLEDYANLTNYLVFAEAYCISGCFFIYYSYNTKLLFNNSISKTLKIKIPKKAKFSGGYLISLFYLVIVLLAGAGYALEIQQYPTNYWFNSQSNINGKTSLAEYYYLYLNFLLLLFVVLVGVVHFGLFKTISVISSRLRNIRKSKNKELMRLLCDDNKTRIWLSPLATQILVSRIFVLSIILNISAWKLGEPKAGIMHEISVAIVLVIGMWFVTLPRYFIQFHIFKIRQELKIHEYIDVRMPWVVGASAFIDAILIIVISRILLNSKELIEVFTSIMN